MGRDGGTRFYRRPDGTFVRVETSGAGPHGEFVFNDADFGGVGDIFSQFFGGGKRQSEGRPVSRDIESVLRLSFDEALHGGKREVTLPEGETVRINIPRGVRSGTRIRLKGHGAPSEKGQRGDLFIVFDVSPHPRFRRGGDDLYVTERINAVEAMLGGTQTITNAYGQEVRIKVAPGTQSGRKLRLRGQGVETEKHTGDLYVELEVFVPDNLSDEAKKELEAWAEKHEVVQ